MPGFDLLNLTSTIGAFILASGVALIMWDLIRPKGKQPSAEPNPWNAGTIEWAQGIPSQPWGIRSIPEIDSRYPLWDQPNFARDIDGRPLLPAGCGGREEGNPYLFRNRCATNAVPKTAGFELSPACRRL